MTLPGLLLLLALEGLAAFLWAFLTPAETGRQVLLWLSTPRLALAAITLLICLGFFAAWCRMRASKLGSRDVLTPFDELLVKQAQLAPALLALTVLPILLTVAVVAVIRTPLDYQAYKTLAPDSFPLLRSLTFSVLPLVAFVVIAGIETAAFIALRYRRALISPSTWSLSRIGPSLLLIFIVIVIGFHWLVLTFQLRFFVNLPAWYWIFDPVPFGPGDIWYLLGAVILFALAYWLLFVRRRLAAGLLVVVALSWFAQMGVGLLGGGGIATLRERYFTTYHQVYVEKASASHTGILEGVRHYEEIYGANTFTGTKAPGLMVFYNALERMVNGSPSPHSDEARYVRFSGAVMVLFPLLAAAAAVLLSRMTRLFLDDASGLVQRTAPLLLVLIPNFVLLTFFADQALYPLGFLFGVCICVVIIRRQSLSLSMALGGLLYVSIFFTFTMLPLFAVTAAYLFLHYWRSRSQQGLRHIIWHAIAIAAGAVALHLLAASLLNYDFLTRLERGMTVHHNIDFYLRVGKPIPDGPESFTERVGQISRAAWFNNLDLAAAIGFPVYLLFLIQAVRRIGGFLRGAITEGDAAVLAILAGFVGINLIGSEQGEVPRLWLFWVPMIVLLAAYELEPFLRRRSWLLPALGLAQWITLMLTYHFQDLRM